MPILQLQYIIYQLFTSCKKLYPFFILYYKKYINFFPKKVPAPTAIPPSGKGFFNFIISLTKIHQMLYSSSPYVGKGHALSSTSISSLSAGSLSSFMVWNT